MTWKIYFTENGDDSGLKHVVLVEASNIQDVIDMISKRWIITVYAVTERVPRRERRKA